MNKTAIKNYAVWARRKLIESVKQRAFEMEITDGGANDPSSDTVAGRPLGAAEKAQRAQLISEIRNRGYDTVMEEAAYTWFNRFIALRFMEVNGYLPSKVRVFTDENGEFKPEILKQAMSIDLEGLDRNRVFALLETQDNEGLYQYLLITQCNALNEALPYMFETISNWTELLFPANLLRPDSVLGRMISDIPEEDWTDQVEIIGWLYQYYISEKHDEVIDPLHGKIIKKEDIPAATQLFTPDWIVRYILDNSLGRYWLDSNPDSDLASKLTYLVRTKTGMIDRVDEFITPEKIKVFDPCVGSGHFLSYAFDILMEIYRESGWPDREAARSIVEKNLYGLDIDDRAAQLACFSVMMKARKYNRRIISSDTVLHVMSLKDSGKISDELLHYSAGENKKIYSDLVKIRDTFIHAKELGSIIKMPKISFDVLNDHMEIYTVNTPETLVDLQKHQVIKYDLLPLIRQAEILSGEYDIVITNPPYLNRFSPILKKYIEENYGDYKGDLFSVFIYHDFEFCKPGGYSGLMTPMVWMFIKTYESLRNYIISDKSITTLIQFEYSAFEEATVPICTFVLRNKINESAGMYFRLSDFKGGMEIQRLKVLEALSNSDCKYLFESLQENFSKIPGSPIAYWIGNGLLRSFENPKLGEIAEPKQGLATADNNRFLRLWFECDLNRICYTAKTAEEALQSGCRWFPLTKGGEFRKWYGNNDYVINWENDGYEIKHFVDENGKLRSVIRNPQYYFRECITWSDISSSNAAFRYINNGFIFCNKGNCIFSSDYLLFFLSFCNSKVVQKYLQFLAPTLNFNVGDIAKLPIILSNEKKDYIEKRSQESIDISKADWDYFETSCDFRRHPLI